MSNSILHLYFCYYNHILSDITVIHDDVVHGITVKVLRAAVKSINTQSRQRMLTDASVDCR
jgi:hypothetical protein